MGDVPFPSTGTVLHNLSLEWEIAILAFLCMLAHSVIAVAKCFNILIL